MRLRPHVGTTAVSQVEVEEAAALQLPPKGYIPPPTSFPLPDRSPRAGYTGDLAFGEFAAGSGSFIRYAKHLGGKCAFFAEKEDGVAQQAQTEAGAGAKRFGDILEVHPQEVPDVFMLLGGPECQPFSKAGKRLGLADTRSRTLWWVLWCLAARQFPCALIENVEALLHMHGGAEWQVVEAVLQGIGYTVQTTVD